MIVDSDLKSNVEAILKDLDLTMSQAVRMFLRQVEKQKELPFNPYQRNFNDRTTAALDNVINNKNISSYKNVDEMFDSWDKD